ncbi:MAG: hypothetical protein RSE41_03875 [Clostridia bacterium]
MGSKFQITKILNYLFSIAIVIFLILLITRLFEPITLNIIPDKHSISEDGLVNELTDCTNTYISSIKNKQYIKANSMNYFLNKKSDEDYNNMRMEIMKVKEPKIIIKEIFLLKNETYRCYYLIKDKTNNSIENLNSFDKKNMNVITIKLDTSNSTFKIITDLLREGE